MQATTPGRRFGIAAVRALARLGRQNVGRARDAHVDAPPTSVHAVLKDQARLAPRGQEVGLRRHRLFSDGLRVFFAGRDFGDDDRPCLPARIDEEQLPGERDGIVRACATKRRSPSLSGAMSALILRVGRGLASRVLAAARRPPRRARAGFAGVVTTGAGLRSCGFTAGRARSAHAAAPASRRRRAQSRAAHATRLTLCVQAFSAALPVDPRCRHGFDRRDRSTPRTAAIGSAAWRRAQSRLRRQYPRRLTRIAWRAWVGVAAFAVSRAEVIRRAPEDTDGARAQGVDRPSAHGI